MLVQLNGHTIAIGFVSLSVHNTFGDIQVLNFQSPLISINFNFRTLATCLLEAQPLQTYT